MVWNNSLHAEQFFMTFLLLLILFKINFFEKLFHEYHHIVQISPEIVVSPDLGCNCLPMSPADNVSKQRVKVSNISGKYIVIWVLT